MILASHAALSSSQKALLKRGKITTVSDLILIPAQDVARKCRVSPLEINAIVETICKAHPIYAQTLDELLSPPNLYGVCTSGDSHLDAALGGGFRTGMVWEVVGESAAGKTQLALRMALLVQLSKELGGLAGSACYLITSGKLPTSRIVQISQHHSLISTSGQCSLDDIHTMPIPSIDFLVQALRKLLPDFIELRSGQHTSDSTVKPVRLVIIDALGELFHSSDKTSTRTLVERAQNITEISAHLHSLASKYGIVVIVLNEVVDAFERQPNTEDPTVGLSYAEQSKWYARAHNLPGENRKEASLGLVWANQINARIMMSRTGRRTHTHSDNAATHKRQKTDVGRTKTRNEETESLELVRRLSIIFSTVSNPQSLDYVVDSAGIIVLEEEGHSKETVTAVTFPYTALPLAIPIAPLDVGCVESESAVNGRPSGLSLAPNDEDDWEAFWENDSITEAMYLAASSDSVK
ncbi:P-loop containing nucleoside triphosphate hydrolase protein [Lentinula aciculospora]|uniref:P-loop containing nucleoside triphosphate hydrolase protein n=1 Tax=Lentinula aciculospora TaxID=153920 RepID=A0A9W9AQC8_9AGAR|nr:P-loop containing nucleoside triphosphate hydrolase protein [Lentinula aciculospora]